MKTLTLDNLKRRLKLADMSFLGPTMVLGLFTNEANEQFSTMMDEIAVGGVNYELKIPIPNGVQYLIYYGFTIVVVDMRLVQLNPVEIEKSGWDLFPVMLKKQLLSKDSVTSTMREKVKEAYE